ncbi:hypothetical protein, partial [Acinetobacter baumannii]|uniref:hypothetical protein n=1 Tax=Acinetobacter baumannii TaxID=470 RepID=UPI001969F73F
KHKIGLYGNIKEKGENYLPDLCRRIASEIIERKINVDGRGRWIVEEYYSREKQAVQLSDLIVRLIRRER